MKLQSLDKAAKYLQEIKQLDEDIIRIDAIALKSASDGLQIKLSLEITDIHERLNSEKKKAVDELMNQYTMMFQFGSVAVKKSYESQFSQSLTSEDTLNVLGVLLRAKQLRRDHLINQLRKLGFSI